MLACLPLPVPTGLQYTIWGNNSWRRHLRAQLVLVGGYVRARHGSLGAIRRAGFMVRRYL
jgi:hypothetical protein